MNHDLAINRVSSSSFAESSSSSNAPLKKTVWILNPALDILFCCGGLVWLFVGFEFAVQHFYKSIFFTQLLATVLALGTHVFGESHVIATWARYIHRVADSPNLRLLGIFGSAGALILFLASLQNSMLVAILLRIYMIWVVFHFTAQSYGISLLYCIKSGCEMTKYDKEVLHEFLNALAVIAIIRQFTFRDAVPRSFLGQAIPDWTFVPEEVYMISIFVFLLFFLRLICNSLLIYAENKKFLPFPACLMILTCIFMFCPILPLTDLFALYVPVFFHATQYLALTFSQHMKEQSPSSSMHGRSWTSSLLSYLAELTPLSLGVYTGVPLLLAYWGVPYDRAIAAVFCTLGLHHFFLDQFMWKLRDPKLRSSLGA